MARFFDPQRGGWKALGYLADVLILSCLWLAMGHLPVTFLLGLGTMGTVYLCLRFAVPVFLMPALLALFASFPIERAFRPYMEETNHA